MTALFSDTHPKMEALQIQLWRQASPTKKMNMVAQLNAAARTLALTSLRNQYPQATKAEIRRKLGDEIQVDVLLERALKVILTCS